MMEQKGLLRLTVLFLAFTCLLVSVASVPVTRSLKSAEDKPSSVQSFRNLFAQEARDISESEEVLLGYINIERRMDIESNDYPGTGANNRHDPKSPKAP